MCVALCSHFRLQIHGDDHVVDDMCVENKTARKDIVSWANIFCCNENFLNFTSICSIHFRSNLLVAKRDKHVQNTIQLSANQKQTVQKCILQSKRALSTQMIVAKAKNSLAIYKINALSEYPFVLKQFGIFLKPYWSYPNDHTLPENKETTVYKNRYRSSKKTNIPAAIWLCLTMHK